LIEEDIIENMSKFIKKLTQIRQCEPQPMGFVLGKTCPEKSNMQLVAYLTADSPEKVIGGLSSADAALVEVTKADDIGLLEKICQIKDGVPSGAWLKASNANTLKKTLNVNCDFTVFPASASLSSTQKDKMGRVLELDASLSEGFLRTANDLPVDAVMVFNKDEENSLTLHRLMVIQRLVYMINKPILVSVPANITGAELQPIWDVGIAGVIVEVSDEKSLENLEDIHKAIEKLAPPAFRKKSKGSPVLPRMQMEPEKPAEEEGGEEEEDE
jgi:hypothetical protein